MVAIVKVENDSAKGRKSTKCNTKRTVQMVAIVKVENDSAKGRKSTKCNRTVQMVTIVQMIGAQCKR